MDNFRDSYFPVTWDLTKKRIDCAVWGKQYDTGRGLSITLKINGVAVTPSNEVIRLKWEKPDKTTGYVGSVIVGDKFIIENIDQMFTVNGAVRADLELQVADEFVASITFYASVEKAVAVDAIESSSEFTAIQEVLLSTETNEALRVSAEATRQGNEATRQQNETGRVTAEGLRATAETGRANAEIIRQTGYATMDEAIALKADLSEIEAARGTEPTLGARLDSTDAQLNDIEQDVVNHEERIVDIEAIIKSVEIKSWAGVQKIVRAGIADKVFSVGDQFTAQYAGVDYLWDVIGVDHDVPADPRFTHSLTVQAHDCLMNCVFDAAELLYFAEAILPVGDYKFYDSYSSKNYAFSIATPVPEGGGIIISAWEEPNTPTQVRTSDAAGVTLETIPVAESSAGTLITCNDLRRARYGSNNYLQSNVRDWLNSDAVTYSPVKTHKYDVLSTAAPYSTGGFLRNLDPDLRSVIGPVKKQVAKNTATDGGGQDLMEDKVFLLSRVEIYSGTEGVTTGESAYPYYSMLAPAATTADLAGRIKYLSGAARYWWLRSPYVAYSYGPRRVYPSGYVSNVVAISAYGLAPACTIY